MLCHVHTVKMQECIDHNISEQKTSSRSAFKKAFFYKVQVYGICDEPMAFLCRKTSMTGE